MVNEHVERRIIPPHVWVINWCITLFVQKVRVSEQRLQGVNFSDVRFHDSSISAVFLNPENRLSPLQMSRKPFGAVGAFKTRHPSGRPSKTGSDLVALNPK